MNKIIISIKDNQTLSVNTKEPITLENYITVLLSATLAGMQQHVKGAPKALKEGLKERIYDAFNESASHVLEQFAPEFELHPNLTAQAILEAENKIIMEGRLSEVTRGS